MSNDDLELRVRAQRPRAGWTATADGEQTWKSIGDRQKDGQPQRGRRTWVLAVAAGLVVAVAGVTLAIRSIGPGTDVAAPRPTNGTVVTIEQGLTYDADDLTEVMAHTDTVFVGKVTATSGRDEDAGWTTFSVEVVQAVAGAPATQVRIRQHGYVDRQGTLHIIENQQLVDEGASYVFAANDEPSLDVYTVAPGPWGARPTEPEGQEDLVQQYRAAR